MAPDPKALARFARVEPPAELDAWVRARLRASAAQHTRVAPAGAAKPVRTREQTAWQARACEPRRETPRRLPAAMPLAERLALAVGLVACGIPASAFVLRVVWSALALAR